jgi:mannitol 2-dehydrogenase
MHLLATNSLSRLPATVAVPGYDRSAISTGIVHFGVGGFHRSHQAVYVDRLMSAGTGLDWGICGVGVLEQDRRVKEVLQAQDYLYTVAVKHPDGRLEARVVGSLVDFLLAPDDPDAVIERMAAPATRVVSLTITEGGYCQHPDTGEFDPGCDAVLRDLRPGAAPTSVFGLMVQALIRRRSRGTAPFTVMSCDNIEGNGDVARQTLAGFARLYDPELGDWVEREVCFPNSMVDRITPATTDADRAAVADHLGVLDGWPVVCEPFSQWVLESTFGGARPPFEQVGVQLVEDVRPYELMKLRLLNAGHQALGYLGHLCGHRYVHEAATDPLIAAFVRGYLDREATPSLPQVPDVDLETYKATVMARFASPAIRDTLARICAAASDRIPKFVLPVVRARLAAGGGTALSALILASWARYAEGTDEHGQPIDVVDSLRDILMAAAARQIDDPAAFLQVREVFGDLADNTEFARTYMAAVQSLHRHGVRATLREATGMPESP